MIHWDRPDNLSAKSYVCGYCGLRVGPNVGFQGTWDELGSRGIALIYICSACNQPTYFPPIGEGQVPGVAFGSEVDALPPNVDSLYTEARRCMSVNAHTSAALGCRKLLMNVAVDKGAEGNKKFEFYVDWLVDAGYVPPGGKVWVDHIRKMGNEATHEIELIEQHSAEQVLAFTEMLLKFVYEFPAKAGAPAS